MRRVGHARPVLTLCLLALSLSGCKQNPFLTPQAGNLQQNQMTVELAQIQELQRRISELNASHSDQTSQIAQYQQQARLAKDETALVKKQLAELVAEYKQQQLAYEQTESRLKAIQASNMRHGGATIRANNSVTRRLQVVEIPGYRVFTEGDVVRIEIPADQLFMNNASQLRPGAPAILDSIGAALAQNYPQQRMVVEGHSAAIPSAGNANQFSGYETSSAQANMVLRMLLQRGRLQSRQMASMSQGSNHPRYSNGTPAGQSANRRIEIVVYPETVE